jgi:hypothetical protein
MLNKTSKLLDLLKFYTVTLERWIGCYSQSRLPKMMIKDVRLTNFHLIQSDGYVRQN